MTLSIRTALACSLASFFSAGLLNAQAPTFEWAIRFGGIGYDLVRSVDTDASGNIYVVGDFFGTVDFDPGPGIYELTTINVGGFIVKLDPDGAFLWARYLHGATTTFAINEISVDPAGNAWIIGTFYGNMDIDPGPAVVNIISNGGKDVFFLRLDPNGNLLRYGRGGGSQNDTGNGIVTDDQGNAYMTGGIMINTTWQAPPHGTGMTAVGFNEQDAYVLKLPAQGDFEWDVHVGSFFEEEGMDIALDGQGNVVVTGYMDGPSDFGQLNPYIVQGVGGQDVFVHKLTNDGEFVFANAVGSVQEDRGGAIAIDAQGNIYTSGYFEGAMDFDPGPGVTTLGVFGPARAFIQKLSPTGAFEWATDLPSANANENRDICIAASGNIWTTGFYIQATDFDPGPGTVNLPFSPFLPNNWTDAFMQQLDANGNYQWAGALGGDHEESGLCIATDPTGAILVGGYFWGTADLNPGTGTANLTSAGNSDAFLVKFSAGINTTVTDAQAPALHVAPVPTNGPVTVTGTAITDLVVLDASGRNVASRTIPSSTAASLDAAHLAPGLYHLRIREAGQWYTRRLVKE